MCFASQPDIVTPAAPPRLADAGVRRARKDELRRRKGSGRNSTILTGPQGLTSTASTTGNTLLGS